MRTPRTFGVLTAVLVCWLIGLSQSASPSPPQSGEQPETSDAAALPNWLPFPIPLQLYLHWRKYGPWDYKQRGSQYRDFTNFNFGATGSAAKMSLDSLNALTQASRPSPDDIRALNDAEIRANFAGFAKGLDELRAMAEKDSHVVRIAPDFTNADDATKAVPDGTRLGDARWNEYRSLFKKLSLSEGIVRSEDFPGAVFFIARAKGLCTGGSSAGYVYSTNELASTSKAPLDALDAAARKNPNEHDVYVFEPLRPDWYAFYELDW